MSRAKQKIDVQLNINVVCAEIPLRLQAKQPLHQTYNLSIC